MFGRLHVFHADVLAVIDEIPKLQNKIAEPMNSIVMLFNEIFLIFSNFQSYFNFSVLFTIFQLFQFFKILFCFVTPNRRVSYLFICPPPENGNKVDCGYWWGEIGCYALYVDV